VCNEIFFASIFDSGGWTIVPKQNKGAVVPVLTPQLHFRDAHENNQIMIFFFYNLGFTQFYMTMYMIRKTAEAAGKNQVNQLNKINIASNRPFDHIKQFER
jgi:hypothetical protein